MGYGSGLRVDKATIPKKKSISCHSERSEESLLQESQHFHLAKVYKERHIL